MTNQNFILYSAVVFWLAFKCYWSAIIEDTSAGSGAQLEVGYVNVWHERRVSVNVIFRLDEGLTEFGDTISVVGNVPALGNWDPQRAVALTTNKQMYPAWQSDEVTIAAVPDKVEFKFIKKLKGGSVKWEEGLTSNREFSIENRDQSLKVVRKKFDEISEYDDVLRVQGPQDNTNTQGAVCQGRPNKFSHPWDKNAAVGCVLGEGAFGRIYKLIFNCQGKTYYAAMKKTATVDSNKGLEPEYELQRVAALLNPYVTKVFSRAASQDLKFEYGLIEFLDGGELSRIIYQRTRRGLASVDGGKLAQGIFAQLVQATFLMHKNGIVHMDLKPPNILVNKAACVNKMYWKDWLAEGCSIKIADFGLSCSVEACARNYNRGTPTYASPKQLGLVQSRVATTWTHDKAMDVWALGIILYELHFGDYPYPAWVRYEHLVPDLTTFYSEMYTNSGNHREFVGSIISIFSKILPQELAQHAADTMNMTLSFDGNVDIEQVWLSPYVQDSVQSGFNFTEWQRNELQKLESQTIQCQGPMTPSTG